MKKVTASRMMNDDIDGVMTIVTYRTGSQSRVYDGCGWLEIVSW